MERPNSEHHKATTQSYLHVTVSWPDIYLFEDYRRGTEEFGKHSVLPARAWCVVRGRALRGRSRTPRAFQPIARDELSDLPVSSARYACRSRNVRQPPGLSVAVCPVIFTNVQPENISRMKVAHATGAAARVGPFAHAQI